MFLQSDWPTIAAANLPSGGAAYPLSTPGIRLKVDPVKDISLMIAMLNGDPAGPGPGDEQLRNRYGLNFRVNDPPFVIGEAQFQRNMGKKDEGLASTLKIGGWGHFGEFNDQRFANDGTRLADPAGSGVALQHRGNVGIYAVIDQQLYRPKGGDPLSGISVYSRVSIEPVRPQPDQRLHRRRRGFCGADPRPARRPVRRGLYLRQVLRRRPRFRPGYHSIHRRPRVVRDYETNLELTYMAQIVPGWWVQPNLQFVWHPNGDASRNATWSAHARSCVIRQRPVDRRPSNWRGARSKRRV